MIVTNRENKMLVFIDVFKQFQNRKTFIKDLTYLNTKSTI